MRKGIEFAQKHCPDLIIMDMELPDINGIEGFKILQSIDETKGIPVMALSANALQDQIEEAMSVGFEQYFIKPLEISKFLETLDSMFS